MELRFLGGAGEIGRSALLIDETLLVDYGMAASTPPQYPVGDVDPEAVVVSHGHLDHVGAVPALCSGGAGPPVHWTAPTRALALRLAEDTLRLHGGTPHCAFTETDVRRLTQVSQTHAYEEPFEAAGYTVTLYDAGHIPGSAHVLVSDGTTRLLYTGDFHTARPTPRRRDDRAPRRRRRRDREHLRGRHPPVARRGRTGFRRRRSPHRVGRWNRRRPGFRHRADTGSAPRL